MAFPPKAKPRQVLLPHSDGAFFCLSFQPRVVFPNHGQSDWLEWPATGGGMRHPNLLMLTGLLACVALSGAQSAENEPSGLCAPDTEFGEFDFWVGSWDVSVASGEVAGQNQITKEQDGCVLVERWTGSKGGTGISLNYYDPDSDQWVQNYVGSGGLLIDIRGGPVDGSIVLDGKIQYLGADRRNAFRGIWTLLADGRVRQYFEESPDGGKTWNPWFEGFYVRRDAGEPHAR